MFAAYCEEYPEMEALWNQYHNAKAGEALKDDAGFWAKQEKPDKKTQMEILRSLVIFSGVIIT